MHASAIRRAASNALTLANGAQLPRLGFGTWKSPKGQVCDASSRALHTSTFGSRRQFSTSIRSLAAAELEPVTMEEAPVVGHSPLLRSSARLAAKTPGIKWTDGEEGIERETRKMNMYTVGTTSACRLRGRRGYATVAFQKALQSKSKARIFPERKTFLYDQYQRLLDESQLLVALQHNNLSVADLSKLRSDIAAIPLPEMAEGKSARPAKLTVVRSGIMRNVCQKSEVPDIKAMEPVFGGPVALLTCASLSPKYLESLFGIVDRTLGHKPSRAPAPGKPFPKTEMNVNPRLVPLAALFEGTKLLEIPAAREVGRLPNLQDLRAQIIGLLSAPSQRLAGTLQQAAGVDIALTLEARKRDLEGDSASSSSS